ncbi:folylpolyglutamate synthase/dihydrofolate synthase family protein [Enterococcus sp.]|uniref:bifunctional folylpolyglutamate synthase/dihydrofolate synthase n=1 Tax=Enterococcus sp. TaxID=35783 RepID=UPI0025C2E69A|nr:folylpolyglutamate synthase/dihydrofolate synthase family protein [Enterococcus sp.]
MTSEEAIAWIHGRKTFGMRPGLMRVEALLQRLGNPEKNLTLIHVAGTNGKGSTVSYLRSLLEESGLQVGTFTSPHIESFNERIEIDGQFIPDDALIEWVETLQPLVMALDQEEELTGITQFEILTALAFGYFAQQQVDVAIIEVGLGGRLDSTNVITPVLTAITTIGMDHMDMLGDTIEAIAAHKAGIIKPHVPLVTGKIPESALSVIDLEAAKAEAAVSHLGTDYQVTYHHPDEEWGEWFDFENERGKIKGLKTSMIGHHQPENACVAIQLYHLFCEAKHLPFSEKVVRNGLKKAYWPARMERISNEPLIIIDGAHNTHAMDRLVETVREEFSSYRIHVLFSALETKKIDEMLQQLLTIPKAEIYLTTFDFPKALQLSDEYQQLNEERISIVSLWQFGLAELLEKMTSEDLLLITGSLYFVSEVRELLLEMGGRNG